MTNLLFLCNAAPVMAGGEKAVMMLTQHLDPAEFQCRVIINGFGPFHDALREAGVPVEVIPCKGRYSVRWHRGLVRSLENEPADVCQLHMSRINALALHRRGGVRVVERLNMVRHKAFFYPLRWVWLDRRTARWLDHFIVVSDWMKQHFLERGYAGDKITVVHNGIALPANITRGKLRRELGVADDVPLVGTAGRLTEQKGMDTFLQTARLLADKHPAARFVIAGSGELEKKLQAQARELGIADRIFWLGYRKDVQDVLADTTVAVFLSRWEPFANVMLEAMAAGTPIVASNAGGNPEAVTDGANGILVKPDQPQAAADAIGGLLTDPDRRARLSQNATRRAKQFSIDRMVDGHARVYRTLAESGTA